MRKRPIGAIQAEDAQWMHDTLEISGLLTCYATALDTKDWALYRSVFTGDADARIDYCGYAPILGNPDQLSARLADLYPSGTWNLHYITNIDSSVGGDVAHVRAMLFNVSGDDHNQRQVGGVHHCELLRTVDGWKISHLRTTCRELTSRA
jgi:hypothetical protein